MPGKNRTIYLTEEQDADFVAGQTACRARGIGIGSIIATALRDYADHNKAILDAIANATTAETESDIEEARRTR